MADENSEAVRQATRDFLTTADMATTTERQVLAAVVSRLGLQGQEKTYKAVVSDVVSDFLASLTPPASPTSSAHAQADPDPDAHGAAAAAAAAAVGTKRGAGGAGAGAAAKKARRAGAADDDDVLLSRELGNRRRARVKRYGGRLQVDVREFYDAEGGEAPGAKGLALAPGEWERLASELPRLVAAQGARQPDAAGVHLSAKRRATLTDFRGTMYLGLREYYEKDGQMLPGKKGINLALSEAQALLAAAPDLSDAAGVTVELQPAPAPAPPPHKPAPAAAPAAGGAAARAQPAAGPSQPAAAPAAAGAGGGGGGGDSSVFDLGGKKRVSVSRYGGRLSVDLREFYEKDGQLAPGKKGIALSPADWEAVAGAAAAISAALAAKDNRYELRLSGSRRVSMSDFRGTTYVAIREYYEKDGQLAPGAKGLNLSPPQWAALAARVADVSAALRREQGGSG